MFGLLLLPTQAFTRQHRISTSSVKIWSTSADAAAPFALIKAGRMRSCFTVLSIPFYRHVAASVYLLDTTQLIYIYIWQCSKCPASPPSTTSHRPTQVRRKPRCHRCHCADLRGDAGRLHLIIFPSSQGCFPWFPAQTRIAEAFSHELQHKLDHMKTYPPWPHRPDWHAACCIRFFLANATPGRL